MKTSLSIILFLLINNINGQVQTSGSANNVIISAGVDFVLDKDIYDYGTKTLTIDDGVTFIANDNVKDGQVRKIVIKAQSIIFKGKVNFKGTGENGENGRNGENCTACDKNNGGVSLYSDRQAYDQSCRDLGRNTGDFGQEGENGHDGIQGTLIVFRYNNRIKGFNLSKFTNNLKGGAGGVGGKGGYNKQVVYQEGSNRSDCNNIPHNQKNGSKGNPGRDGTISQEKTMPSTQ